jgi:hypothetical protein
MNSGSFTGAAVALTYYRSSNANERGKINIKQLITKI